MLDTLNTFLSSSAPTGDISSVISALDFTIITKNISAVITAGAGVTLTAMALKKGWSYLMGFLRRV